MPPTPIRGYFTIDSWHRKRRVEDSLGAPVGHHGAQLPTVRTGDSRNGPRCRSQSGALERTCVGNLLIYLTYVI